MLGEKIIIESISSIDEKDLFLIFEEIILEINTRLIEPELKKKLTRVSFRRELLKKCEEKGIQGFLLPDPKKPKFPVVDENCKYHCGLLAAAYFRANEWKHKHPEYKEIAKKAEELFYKNNCDEKIQIHLRESEMDMDIGTFIHQHLLVD